MAATIPAHLTERLFADARARAAAAHAAGQSLAAAERRARWEAVLADLQAGIDRYLAGAR